MFHWAEAIFFLTKGDTVRRLLALPNRITGAQLFIQLRS